LAIITEVKGYRTVNEAVFGAFFGIEVRDARISSSALTPLKFKLVSACGF
jgi:hypothetical protein